MTQDPWDGILDPDEEILWQGQPTPGWPFSIGKLALLSFGLIFAVGSALDLFAKVTTGSGDLLGPILGLMVGLWVIGEGTLIPIIANRRTWYTLTNRRAFVAKLSLLGTRQLKSYPIDKTTPIEVVYGRHETVYFANEVSRDSEGDETTQQIGFERLADATAVARLIRDIQKDQQ